MEALRLLGLAVKMMGLGNILAYNEYYFKLSMTSYYVVYNSDGDIKLIFISDSVVHHSCQYCLYC